MKIVLFTDTIGDLNGVSRFLQDMAEHARLNGDDLQVVTSTRKSCPEAENIHNFTPRFRLPMPFYKELDLAFPPRAEMEAYVRQNRPDLIHVSTPGPVGIVGRQIAKKLGVRVLGTYHTDFPAYIRDNTGSQLLKRLADRGMHYFYNPFVHVFTRSETYGKIMQEEIGVPQEKIAYIRAGINIDRFSPAYRDETVWNGYGLDRDSVKVLYVGRISKEKNVPFLLEVWRLFKTRYPELNAELVMAGEGSYKHDARAMKSMGVHYLGPVTGEALSTLYASSDLFVFPSVTDTLGQVVMESAASGLPIIVSNIGGPKSLIDPYAKSGYALDITADTWVEHMRVLVENSALRNAFGRAGHRYMQGFPIEHSYEDFIGVHRDYFNRVNG